MTRMHIALVVFVAATAVLLAGTAISPVAASRGPAEPKNPWFRNPVKKPSTVAADQRAGPQSAKENVSADAAKKKKNWLQWLLSPFKRKPSEKKPTQKEPVKGERDYYLYNHARKRFTSYEKQLLVNQQQYKDIAMAHSVKNEWDLVARASTVRSLDGLSKANKELAQNVTSLVADVKHNTAISDNDFKKIIDDCQRLSMEIQALTKRIDQLKLIMMPAAE